MPTNKEFLAKKVELDDKQDKLTAGDNITINPNTNIISANYPDVIGATSSTAGTRGLVPAPAAGDEDKFLKGNGTWGSVSAGSASLAGLTDVDLNSPTDGQALVYDLVNQKWVNGNAGNTDYVELTQAEYDALTEEQKTNGTLYFITDGEGGGGSGGSGISGLDWANKVTVTTSVIAPQSSITYTPPKGGILIITGYGSSTTVQATLNSSLITNKMYFPLLYNAYTTHEVVVNENDELTIGNGSSISTMADLAIYFVPFLGGSSSSSSIDYSTEEQKTGQKWIDGKDIYQITIPNIALTTTNTQTDITSLTIDNIVDYKAVYRSTSLGMQFLNEYIDRSDWLSTQIYLNKIRTICTSWYVSNGFIASYTIQYTKITD